MFDRVFICFTGFYWVLLSLLCETGFLLFFSGLNCVLLCLTGFYWVLLGLKGFTPSFHWVQTKFHQVSTMFDRVFICFTGFYWVLLSLLCETGFLLFFSGLNCVLLCLTRFYWVYKVSLLVSTGLNQVYLGFTVFDDV